MLSFINDPNEMKGRRVLDARVYLESQVDHRNKIARTNGMRRS